MSKPTNNIHLKGYVGGADFDRNAVDSMLAANNGKQVNVLIDSLGGSLATEGINKRSLQAARKCCRSLRWLERFSRSTGKLTKKGSRHSYYHTIRSSLNFRTRHSDLILIAMARSIHISTARTMLNSGDPVDIRESTLAHVG